MICRTKICRTICLFTFWQGEQEDNTCRRPEVRQPVGHIHRHPKIRNLEVKVSTDFREVKCDGGGGGHQAVAAVTEGRSPHTLYCFVAG